MQATLTSEVRSNLELFSLEHFSAKTLMIESVALRGSPWGADFRRHNPVLVPKGGPPRKGYPLVLALSGFSGNGPHSFAPRGFDQNLPQVIDSEYGQGRAPRAIYCFVDAWTPWGGSQFINSPGMGQFEDYIINEILPTLREEFSLSADAKKFCVLGPSSGGYGALSLASRFSDLFGIVVALAPDSFFRQSLLPEIYQAAPMILEAGGVKGVWHDHRVGRFHTRRDAFRALNAVAMGLCYAPSRDGKDVHWPIDLKTGELDEKIWAKWTAHDPLEFLPKRRAALRNWHRVFLDVGQNDQFNLQFGARQLRDLFRKYGVNVTYSEFDGGHFDLAPRRQLALQWLHRLWKV